MIFIVIFTLLLAYILNYLYKKWRVYSYLLKNFKCPPRHPLLGNLHLFPKNPHGIFETNKKLNATYGKNFAIVRPIFVASITVADSKDAESLLSNPNTRKAKKAPSYKSVEPWLGTGLLTSYGDKWFNRRKVITPSFHFSILDGFVDVMSKQSDILIEHLKKQVGSKDFNIYPIINAFALDVICETSMGVTVDAQANPFSKYVVTVKKISQALQQRIHHPLGRTHLYDLTSSGKYLKKLIQILHNFTESVIQERRERLLLSTESAKGGRMNFLDILLHATTDGKPLTNLDIREEVDTFMFEGHDTTASGIAFTLYLLSRNSDVQERLYLELKDSFGSKTDMNITNKSLSDLVYLDMVVKESLRLFPPVPAIGRELMDEEIIGGVPIPAGIDVRINIYAMHHDPEYFPNPEKFDPERFSATSVENKKTFAYVPFSAGGRNCIGQRFAMLDIKATIVKVLMNFKLFPGEEVILQGDLILKATNGVHVRLEER